MKLTAMLAKYVIGTLSFATIVHTAVPEQFLHGTYFLAGINTDYAVVAIDSRESRGDGTILDRYCKIRALSDQVIFFATGTTSAVSAKTGSIIFDARDVAQRTFEYFTGDNFKDLANRWAKQMEGYYGNYANSFTPVVNVEIAEGFFIGINRLNKIEASTAIIFRRPDLVPGFAFHSEQIIPGSPGDMRLLNNGHFEILDEFYGKSVTERAKKIIAETAGWKPGPDTDATRYSSYVAAIRDWSGDMGIGGEVTTIILERGRGLRWFHRPDFCPGK
jgi:hypothetical protein